MWKLVQWHEYMTQEGINSHLRAHSILSPFVTCTIYKVSCRILCSWVFESPQHAAVITQRHRLVVASESKKSTSFSFSEKIYYRTTVSRRHFLPLKATASFHNAFCFHFFLIDVCLMRKWGKKLKISFSELWLPVFCFPNQSSMNRNSTLPCSYCGLHDYGSKKINWKRICNHF